MKKEYIKPNMDTIVLKAEQVLLSGSVDLKMYNDEDEYEGEFS